MNDAIGAIESHRILSRNRSRWAIYGLVLLIFTGRQGITFAGDAVPTAHKRSASIAYRDIPIKISRAAVAQEELDKYSEEIRNAVKRTAKLAGEETRRIDALHRLGMLDLVGVNRLRKKIILDELARLGELMEHYTQFGDIEALLGPLQLRMLELLADLNDLSNQFAIEKKSATITP